MRIIVLLAGVIVFGWFVTKADPRSNFHENCAAAAEDGLLRDFRADAARAAVLSLTRNADVLYGPWNRAKQRIFNAAASFGFRISDPTFYARVGAAVEELGFIYDTARALSMSACATQHLVPDHRSDSVGAARTKLHRLMQELEGFR